MVVGIDAGDDDVLAECRGAREQGAHQGGADAAPAPIGAHVHAVLHRVPVTGPGAEVAEAGETSHPRVVPRHQHGIRLARPALPPVTPGAVGPTGPRAPPPGPGDVRPRHLAWAELLRRTFAVDVLACPHRGGRLRLVATLADPRVIARSLAHLGLPLEPPGPVPPRQPSCCPPP